MIKTTQSTRLIFPCALGLLVSLTNVLEAQTETESNDSFGTANVINISATISGDIGTGETDFFIIPNGGAYTSIEVIVTFSGIVSGGDNDITIFANNQTTKLFDVTPLVDGSTPYTISPAVSGENYYVRLYGNSPDLDNQYSIQVIGTLDVGTLDAEALQKLAVLKKKIKKTKKAITKAKRKAQTKDVKRLKAKLRKYKRTLNSIAAA